MTETKAEQRARDIGLRLRSVISDTDFDTPAIVFVATRQETQLVAEELAECFTDCAVAHVHSGVPKMEREQLLANVKSGTVQVVVATDVWSTGIDIPELRTVVLAYTGSAPIGLLQRVGRVTRATTGKTAARVIDLRLGSEAQQHTRAAICEAAGMPVEHPEFENGADAWHELESLLGATRHGRIEPGKTLGVAYRGTARQTPPEMGLGAIIGNIVLSPFGLLFVIGYAIVLYLQ